MATRIETCAVNAKTRWLRINQRAFGKELSWQLHSQTHVGRLGFPLGQVLSCLQRDNELAPFSNQVGCAKGCRIVTIEASLANLDLLI